MSRTTSAIVVREPNGAVALEPIILGELRPDEALVEIHATGVCHTDLLCMKGELPAPTPIVLGHEGAGVVVAKGAVVQDLEPGDKVILSYSYCGICDECTHNHEWYCHSLLKLNFRGVRADGTSALKLPGDGDTGLHGHFFGQSSFSRFAIVSASSLVKVPPNTPLDLFAPLGCGLQTGAGAVLNTLDVQPGASLAVFGVGSVGMSAIMAAKLRSAGRIIAVDMMPARLKLAKKLGATDTILASEKDVVDRIKTLCPPSGVKYALDCSGNPQAVASMIDSLGTRGRACSVGAPAPDVRTSVNVFAHLINGREYVGCHQGESLAKEMIPFLIQQHTDGRYPLEELITYYNAEDFQTAFSDTEKGVTIKAVLKWA
ncbi:alcohol dehydrogenase [Dactylonectria estremocensis]|uniref:Alcohol dehydrogenase n=1 Tax=Dactylonectria estremocensis TaxID=1079267 RepID=A0A9P9EXW6_9HYPO|nr:alcohol dehydrogenase [Dactylonectria estremocensis]